MLKTFKYKLYNNKRNKKLSSLVDMASSIYNHCIALHKRYYSRFHKHLDKNTLQKHITKLKKLRRFNSWNRLNSQAIQAITDKIHLGYLKFFNKDNLRPPSFKSKRRYSSFTLKQTGYKFYSKNGITINGFNFRFFKSRDTQGDIKTVTVKRDRLGDFYIYVVCENGINEVNKVKTGKTAGFDFGLKTYLTSSDGSRIESPQFLKQSLQQIKKSHRSLSKKKKGSNNRERARRVLCRDYRRIENQRHDFQFKLAKQLCDQYDELYFESLNLEGMKRLWGRKVSDLAFHSFLSILEKYCQKTGTVFLKIGRWEATSKTCHICGYVKNDLTLDDRIWTCPNCGHQHDRDLNAAINIKTVGTSTVKGEEVRLSEIMRNQGLRKHSSYHKSANADLCATLESPLL
jgi:putative transposase